MDELQNRSVVGTAPPPPSEVKIRTMRSDLESMAKSGGGMPKFENVPVKGLSIEKEYKAPVAEALPDAQVVSPSKKSVMPLLIVGLVGVAAFAIVGYIAYVTLFAGNATTQTPSGQSVPVTATSTTASSTTQQPVTASTSGGSANNTLTLPLELSSAHRSVFTKTPDQIVTVNFPPVSITGAQNSSSLYKQTMTTALAKLSVSATMIEINPKATDGNNLSMEGLLAEAEAPIISANVLSNFNPDATFFVYRDKNGLWPGYIVALNAGDASSSVSGNLQQQIESASNGSNIGNLFLASVGPSSATGFTDNTIAGAAVRTISFGGSYTPVYFTYGWHGNYLILSTSQNGFAAAVAALQ